MSCLRPDHSRQGSALVMVIMALALLMSLGLPFLLIGKMRSESALGVLGRAQARVALDAASTFALVHQAKSHPSFDPDPLWDSVDEWDPATVGPLPSALGAEWEGSQQSWGIETESLQGRISLATASPVLLQNLLHPCYITTDVDFRTTELPVTSTDGFPDAGLLFVSSEWLQYGNKTSRAFTELVPAVEDDMPEDLSETRIREGTVVIDPRVWNLVFARLQDGEHRPPEFLSEIFDVDITGSGPLPESDKRVIERHTCLASGRFGQPEFGPGVWLTRPINPEAMNIARVSDSSGFSGGTLARFVPEQGDPFEMYVFASSLGGVMRMASDLPSDLDPQTTLVYPLMREPVDLNSATPEVLQALVAGLSWRSRPVMPTDEYDPPTGNWYRDWVHPSQARKFAARVVALRPLHGPADLWDRLLEPMRESGGLTHFEAWAIFQNGLDADYAGLRYSTAPFAYRSGDRYLQRVNVALRTRLGSTLADLSAWELVHVAPDGPALRLFHTQEEFDDIARWARGANGVTSIPFNLGQSGGLHLPATAMALRTGAWNPAGIVRPGGLDDDDTWLIPQPARASDVGYLGGYGRTEHFDFEPSPLGRDIGTRGPLESQLFEWGVVGEDQIYSADEPLNLQAWFEVPSGNIDGGLFDIYGPATDGQRVTAAFEDGMLVMRAWDNAGEDPLDPEGYEEAVRVQVDPAEYPLTGRSLHLGMTLRGVSPRGVQFTVDGIPRGDINCLTWTTAAVGGYSPGSTDTAIEVESTAGFPLRGVIRIGDEVIEYSSKTGTSFITERTPGPGNYLGGRAAREGSDTMTGALDSVHPAGAGVELYGYSSWLSTDIPPGGASISGDIGPFSVAVSPVAEMPISLLSLMGFSFEVGQGIDGAWIGDLELAPMAAGDPYYEEAFQSDGGYALLFQRRTGWEDVSGARIGGWEVVRYTARANGAITIIERNVMTPGFALSPSGVVSSTGNSFIGEWAPFIVNFEGEPIMDLPEWRLYVMPISIKGSSLSDITYLGPDEEHSEFVQLYTPGDSESTEWVRYDSIFNNCFLRDDWSAINRAVGAYVINENFDIPEEPPGGGGGGGGGGGMFLPRQDPWSDWAFTRTIGQPIDDRDTTLEAIRLAFDFRGVLGTFDHAQTAGTSLVPVFRTVRGAGAWTGYVGRLDRVAVMQPGSDGVSNPQWFTVEWGAPSRPTDDRIHQNANYVAFQQTPGIPFLHTDLSSINPAEDGFDPRMIARLCKFPSGERPSHLQILNLGGSSTAGTFQGFIDEVQMMTAGGMGPPQLMTARGAFVLEEDLSATEVDSLELNDYALVVATQRYYAQSSGAYFSLLQSSGLIDIDGERIAYSDFDPGTGLMTLAPNGRGVHGTEPRGHAAGASVNIVDGRPSTVLSAALEAEGEFISTDSTSGFAARPLLLVGDELMHPTLPMFGGTGFSMPRRRPRPDQDDDGGEALLRGRFGTLPAAHQIGTLVYSMPVRWEDRWIPQCNDPGGAWFQLGFHEPEAFWRGLRFNADLPDSSHHIRVAVRAGTADWEDEPGVSPGLLQLESKDMHKGMLPINLASDRLELRFSFDWDTGAFDAVDFLSTGWLQAPRLRDILIDYMAESRVDYREEIRE